VIDCTEARGLIGADLLGRLDPGERGRLAEHLRICPGCAERRTQLEGVVDMVDLAGPPEAAKLPAGFEERLVAHGVAELAPPPRRRIRRPGGRSLGIAAAGAVAGAAAALALAAVFGGFGGSSGAAPSGSWEVRLVATSRAPTAKAVAYLINRPGGATIALQAQGLPVLRRGDRCVVWIAGRSASYSAGTIQISRGWATAILRAPHRAVHGSMMLILIVPAHGGAPEPLLRGRV
jgi:anti-sigma factor RsiW